jgi:hypothetical protein
MRRGRGIYIDISWVSRIRQRLAMILQKGSVEVCLKHLRKSATTYIGFILSWKLMQMSLLYN